MFNTSRRKFIIAIILIAEAVLIVLGINYRKTQAEREAVLLDIGITVDISSVIDVELSPSFPTSFDTVDVTGIFLVSTGNISNLELKDGSTGEVIAQSSILETVAYDSNGKVKRLLFVLQLSPITSPDRNVMPWVVQKDEMLSNEQLAQLFPKGSPWLFIPFLNLGEDEVKEFLVEYGSYAQRYYRDSLSSLQDFINNGLVGGYSKPILLLDLLSKDTVQ